jgi:TRAP-type C4-dicarboxylate transport system permease small subunit
MIRDSSILYRTLVAIGGAALLIAMAVDALALVGRNLGVPLLGSIEIVQTAVLVSGAVAMLIATFAGVHARVRLLVARATPRLRNALEALALAASAAFFLALAAGNLWIAHDMWSGGEESELLHLPYRPLRLFVVLAMLFVAIAFAARALSRRQT